MKMDVKFLPLILLVTFVLDYSLANAEEIGGKWTEKRNKVRRSVSLEDSPIIQKMEKQIQDLEEQVAKLPKNVVHIHMHDGSHDEHAAKMELDHEDHPHNESHHQGVDAHHHHEDHYQNESIHVEEGAINYDDDHKEKPHIAGTDNDQHIHMHMHLEPSDCHSDDNHIKHEEIHAHCEVFPNSNLPDGDDIRGNIHMIQNGDDPVEIFIKLNGFDMTKENAQHSHGFHVHTYGDTMNSCDSLGAHYNPFVTTHGDKDDSTRHIGDLGNIVCDMNGEIDHHMTDAEIDLHGKHSLIGRSIAIHAGPDDLGKGGDAGSLKGGNAGPKIACCIIALADHAQHQHNHHHAIIELDSEDDILKTVSVGDTQG